MRSLNLDQLRTLLEVLALGNFSAAARRLNLSQPAVSLHIRELEQHFGVPLIERMGRHAQATAPGRELAQHAERIFSECDEANSTMRRFRDGWLGRVHIGTTLTALTYHLPPILRQLRIAYPTIDLLVTNLPTRDSVDGVLNNTVDLGLVTLPVRAAQLRITPLRPEMSVAILPADTEDIPDVVTPAYAAAQPLVLEFARAAGHTLVSQWLSEYLPLPGQPMLIATVEAMKSVVAMGLGMAIVPDIAVATPIPGIVVRPLDPPLPCTMGLIEHRNKPNSPAQKIVRSALLELKLGGSSEAVAGLEILPPVSKGRKRNSARQA